MQNNNKNNHMETLVTDGLQRREDSVDIHELTKVLGLELLLTT